MYRFLLVGHLTEVQQLATHEVAHIGRFATSIMSLIKSKQRVADHGEVFTPLWLVEAMLDLVKDETERIDSRFLEPACGSGNFLVVILKRKLAAVENKYGKSEFERKHFALLALMCVYGIELLEDNVMECRGNLLHVFREYIGSDTKGETVNAAQYVLTQNIVHANAMTMRTIADRPIAFPEWGYLGKGRYQRRDFEMASLASVSSHGDSLGMFSHASHAEKYVPVRVYRPITIAELASTNVTT